MAFFGKVLGEIGSRTALKLARRVIRDNKMIKKGRERERPKAYKDGYNDAKAGKPPKYD